MLPISPQHPRVSTDHFAHCFPAPATLAAPVLESSDVLESRRFLGKPVQPMTTDAKEFDKLSTEELEKIAAGLPV